MIILLVLLLALLLGGLGFAIHILWWIALVVLVIWLLGFALRAGEGTSRGRWYRWLSVTSGRVAGGVDQEGSARTRQRTRHQGTLYQGEGGAHHRSPYPLTAFPAGRPAVTLNRMGDQVAEAAPVVVRLPAEIDVTNSEVAFGLLVAALTPGVGLVIGDLTATSFCDTSGIRALARAQEEAEARNARLRLAIPPGGSVRRVLELTGVIHLLDVYPGLDEAIAG